MKINIYIKLKIVRSVAKVQAAKRKIENFDNNNKYVKFVRK